MSLSSAFYPEHVFGGFTDIDGTIVFYSRVNALITSSSLVVDIGCGRGEYGEDPVPFRRSLRILRGKARRVVGINVDTAAQENPFIDEFHLLRGEEWELDSSSADLCLCDFVMEHIPNPDSFFSEARRVLKPDGYLCIRTPNRLGYVVLLSRIIPNSLHRSVLKKVQNGRKEVDIFPTYYRCNSIGALQSALHKHDFAGIVYGYEGEPSYCAFSRLAYWFGCIYQRFSPRAMRNCLFAFAQVKK